VGQDHEVRGLGPGAIGGRREAVLGTLCRELEPDMPFYSEFADYYDTVFPFEERTYGFIRDRLPKEASLVLDVGCGTGDYCGRLASQGFEMVGIDPDPWMIERARRRYPAAEFHIGGMQDVRKLGRAFDSAFCIGNVASHLPSHRLPVFLQGLHELLKPFSVWIVQTVNWDHVLTQQSYAFPDVVARGGELVFERSYPEISEDRVLFRTRLLEGGSVVFEGEETLYPLASAGLIEEHERNGFELVSHNGGFEARPFDPAVMSGSVFVFRRP
jgi:SAM-dependent methyltransferase